MNLTTKECLLLIQALLALSAMLAGGEDLAKTQMLWDKQREEFPNSIGDIQGDIETLTKKLALLHLLGPERMN